MWQFCESQDAESRFSFQRDQLMSRLRDLMGAVKASLVFESNVLFTAQLMFKAANSFMHDNICKSSKQAKSDRVKVDADRK